MKCKFCDEMEANTGGGLCDRCARLAKAFKAKSQARQAMVKALAVQMADDLLDESFGPEAGTVIN
jgi:hypothetical protein